MIENKNKKIEFDYDKGGSSTERRKAEEKRIVELNLPDDHQIILK